MFYKIFDEHREQEASADNSPINCTSVTNILCHLSSSTRVEIVVELEIGLTVGAEEDVISMIDELQKKMSFKD